LRSGCRAAHSKLRTAARLANLLAMFCILGRPIFWLTMLQRSTRHAAPTLAFTPLEIHRLSRLAPTRACPKSQRPASLHSCLIQLVRLGGYLARTGNAPPGNTVMWRGLSRLSDIEISFFIGAQNVGNCGRRQLSWPPCCLTKECYPSSGCRSGSFFSSSMVGGCGHVVEGCGGGQRSRAAARCPRSQPVRRRRIVQMSMACRPRSAQPPSAAKFFRGCFTPRPA